MIDENEDGFRKLEPYYRAKYDVDRGPHCKLRERTKTRKMEDPEEARRGRVRQRLQGDRMTDDKMKMPTLQYDSTIK